MARQDAAPTKGHSRRPGIRELTPSACACGLHTARARCSRRGEGLMDRRGILLVVLVLALLGGAALAYTQVSARDAQIRSMQADLDTARDDASVARTDLQREN